MAHTLSQSASSVSIRADLRPVTGTDRREPSPLPCRQQQRLVPRAAGEALSSGLFDDYSILPYNRSDRRWMMSVGQLVYKMRANHLSVAQAAADMDLPLEQVLEALAYYQTHRELIESETAEEKVNNSAPSRA